MGLDLYPSVATLEEHEGNQSYQVHCLNRCSPVTIIAPHGGFIEPGTSALAARIAACRYNLFDFRGLLSEQESARLHVTSTRFRHAHLDRLLADSSVAVSIHSMGLRQYPTIWLGGLNYALKQEVLEQLLRCNFDVNPDSPMYRGESPLNVVNLARNRGVQLELSGELVFELFDGEPFLPNAHRPKTTARFAALVNAVRAGIRRHLRSPHNQAGWVAERLDPQTLNS
jgi:phage replication-related protein YjqB (UPF0714/DUF867 family)